MLKYPRSDSGSRIPTSIQSSGDEYTGRLKTSSMLPYRLRM